MIPKSKVKEAFRAIQKSLKVPENQRSGISDPTSLASAVVFVGKYHRCFQRAAGEVDGVFINQMTNLDFWGSFWYGWWWIDVVDLTNTRSFSQRAAKIVEILNTFGFQAAIFKEEE